MQTHTQPTLNPLGASWEDNDVERDLKKLTMDLFELAIRPTERDINTSGVPFLGSFSLVERAAKSDGLAIYRRADVPALRYLYKTWKARNPKRGLWFLRTYLQMLWPNTDPTGADTSKIQWTAERLWYPKTGQAYYSPQYAITDTQYNALSAGAKAAYFLTSRIGLNIKSFAATNETVVQVLRPVRSALAAKFVLQVVVSNGQQFLNNEEANAPLAVYGALTLLAVHIQHTTATAN